MWTPAYTEPYRSKEFQQLTCWLCCRFQGVFYPKDDCFSLGRSLWSALQRQGSSLTHTDCIIQGDIGTHIYHLLPVISACLGTGGLQARCCHVCSLVVWGLCYKDQNSEFFLISIYCHLLGVFPRSWELCRRMDVSPGSTHVHISAKSYCSGNFMKYSWSWHWKCGIVAVLQVLSQVWWQEFSW